MSTPVPRRTATIHAPDPAAKRTPAPPPREDRQLLFADLLRRPARLARADLAAVVKVQAPALKAEVAPGWPLPGASDPACAEEPEGAGGADPSAPADAAAQEDPGDSAGGDGAPEGNGDGDSDGSGSDADRDGADDLAPPVLEAALAAQAAPPGSSATALDPPIRLDARGLAVVDYLAATVTGFCNAPGVSASEGWRVRIDLNADILPATRLHVQLSPHWLLLRFECGDVQAKSLVCTHQDRLRAALDEALVPRRDISIDID